jgi:hypothetical protein
MEAAFLSISFMNVHWKAALYAELALRTWPASNSTAADTAASSTSSTSSSGTVRYGTQVLPRLAPVSAEAALPAALATAHTLASCIDALASYMAMDDQQLLQLLPVTAAQGAAEQDVHNYFRQVLPESSHSLAVPPVLALQLLLLAHQAKLQHAARPGTHGKVSEVNTLTPTTLQQQQQLTDDVQDKLMLHRFHCRLLAAYKVAEHSIQNLAALEQQQVAALPHNHVSNSSGGGGSGNSTTGWQAVCSGV